MKRKSFLSLLLVLVLGMSSIGAYAAELAVDLDETEAMWEEAIREKVVAVPELSPAEIAAAVEALEVEAVEVAPDVTMDVLQSAQGIIAVARTYDDLLVAIAAESVSGVYLINDIQLEGALEIGRDFSFEGLYDGVSLIAKHGYRHIVLRARSNEDYKLELNNIILEGDFTYNPFPVYQPYRGGIELEDGTDSWHWKKLEVTGGTIQNCYAEYGGAFFAGYYATLTVSDCTVIGNYAKIQGGGIFARLGVPLTVDNCTVTRNSTLYEMYATVAHSGGGIHTTGNTVITNSTISSNIGDVGGGIYISKGRVENCIIENNSCSYRGTGGGINAGENTEIINCIISGNKANSTSGYGGGVYGPTNIIDCIIENNSARYGGGVALGNINNVPWELTVTNSQIRGNSADYGGGAAVTKPSSGNTNYVISFIDCEISDNAATTSGGGIFRSDGFVNLTNTVITNNTPENIVWE